MKKFFSITKAFFTVVMMMAFLGMAACAKKTNGGASRVQNRGTGNLNAFNTNGVLGGNNINYGQQNGIPNQNSCAGAQSAGRLVDDGSSYGSFRANFAEFLGEDIGELDGNANSTTTGVDFQLRLKVNGQTVSPEQSSMAMVVWDSYSSELGEIQVSYQPAVSANVSASGDFTLTFQDNYGQIFVQGRVQGNIVQGRVQFQNSGGQTKSLGAFTLSSCAVLY